MNGEAPDPYIEEVAKAETFGDQSESITDPDVTDYAQRYLSNRLEVHGDRPSGRDEEIQIQVLSDVNNSLNSLALEPEAVRGKIMLDIISDRRAHAQALLDAAQAQVDSYASGNDRKSTIGMISDLKRSVKARLDQDTLSPDKRDALANRDAYDRRDQAAAEIRVLDELRSLTANPESLLTAVDRQDEMLRTTRIARANRIAKENAGRRLTQLKEARNAVAGAADDETGPIANQS